MNGLNDTRQPPFNPTGFELVAVDSVSAAPKTLVIKPDETNLVASKAATA
jgi:hypothetical protein